VREGLATRDREYVTALHLTRAREAPLVGARVEDWVMNVSTSEEMFELAEKTGPRVSR